MTINQNFFKAPVRVGDFVLQFRFASIDDLISYNFTEDPMYIVPLIIEECETWRN